LRYKVAVQDQNKILTSIKEQQRVSKWFAVDLTIASDAREAVEYAVIEACALGSETNDTEDKLVRVTAYFDHLPQRERVRAELSEALRIYSLPSSSVLEISMREFPDQDWLGEWKKSWQPVESGRFIIAPPWTELSVSADRIVIRIEPGMAFGTGTHETTRLCLTAIEKYFSAGSFLDVGTGTGVLAIAAAKLFPSARVEACDTDAAAIAIARENARLNEVSERIAFRAGSIEDSTASADFVCANLTANVISDLLPALQAVTCGRLVLSGILDSQVEDVVAQLRQDGLSEPVEIMNDGEWSALIL
jgi:ribosomal protein L11 methyltransferase